MDIRGLYLTAKIQYVLYTLYILMDKPGNIMPPVRAVARGTKT